MWGLNVFGGRRHAEARFRPGVRIVARLNARVQPTGRTEAFEEPLDAELRRRGIGFVTGGDSQLDADPYGIAFCDVEIQTGDDQPETLAALVEALEELDAPKGSRLLDSSGDTRELARFGRMEGLALFLNATDLGEDVYRETDVDEVIFGCDRLMGDAGTYRGLWHGRRETALYFYGPSFARMQQAITGFTAEYPLCRKSRVERVA